MPKTGFLNKMGSLLYGNVEGVLDTVSFGLTDTMTDKLWQNTLNKKGAKNLNQFRGAGNIAGAVGGGILTGNVSGAINEGLEGFGDIAGNSQNADFQKAEKFAQLGAQIASFVPNSGSLTNFGSKMANVTSNPMVSGTMGQLNSFVGQSASQPKQISANVPKDVVYSTKQDTNFADGGEVAIPQMPKILQSLKNKTKRFEDGGEVEDPVKPGLSATTILPMNPQQFRRYVTQTQQPELTLKQRLAQQRAAEYARRSNTTESTRFTPMNVSKQEREQAAYNSESAQRERRLADSKAAQEESLFTSDNWQQLLARQTQATGDKLDVPFLPNWIDPFYAIGSMASSLGAMPYNIQQGNYGQATLGVLAPVAVGALGGIGARTTGQFVNNVVNPAAGLNFRGAVPKKPPGSGNVAPVVNTARNLEDLKAAQQFAQQYGYELPTNIERIAQSNQLTDRTIRGMMDRHNTFVRGVSTNWEELGKRNPEILRHLEGKGFDLSTKEGTKQAAEYMATHIPINTGYGRASLNTEVFDKGLQGLYTSNSIPTAEGYTYGQGFITKAKRPTNYSSFNRQDWITQNNPQYYEHNLPGGNTLMIDGKVTHPINMKLPYLYSVKDYDDINVFKNTVIKDLEKQAFNLKTQFERTVSSNPEYSQNMKNSYDEVIKKIEDIKTQKWEASEFKLNKNLLKTEHYSPSNQFSFQELNPDNKYAHYIHLGTPGEKVLEPIKSWEITPEIWKNKSRSHTNNYSKKFSAMSMGGIITPPSAIIGAGATQEYKKGGLIKRADGSYSKRGLWDNIRANRGSGKKPTAEMLKQERKIKRNS